MESLGDDDTVRVGQAKAAALSSVRSRHREAETLWLSRIESIRAARLFGATWAEVGDALGVSRQTAHKRFGPYVDDV